MSKIILSKKDIHEAASALAFKLREYNYDCLVAIPNGGYHVAAVLSPLLGLPVISCYDAVSVHSFNNPLIVDDLIDSGETIQKLGMPFATAVLFRKPHSPKVSFFAQELDGWIVFPWETENGGIEENITRVFQYIGEDPTREGLLETPSRIVRSWDKLFGGYKQNPDDFFKEFESPGYDEMVLLKNIEFYSTCEHHFLPFHGVAHIAYIPNSKVIGISKLARLLEVFTRRMQIQERIGESIVELLMTKLDAKGAAVILEAQHMCMTARGVEKQHSKMVTSSLRGVFKEKSEARAELLQLIKN